MFYTNKEKSVVKKNTSPTSADIKIAKEKGIDLANSWNAYSREVRLHIFASDIKEMTRFYNKILEFPVVRTWQDSIESGVLLNIGGNIIELFSKTGNKDNKKFFGNCSFSLRVKDVSKLHDKFSRKNITIGSLENNSWGDTSFTVSDIEGNQITFFTPNFSYNKYYKVKIN